MSRHVQGLDRGYELSGGIAPPGLFKHCKRFARVKIEVRRVVANDPSLVNEGREDREIFFLERREVMAIDARRLLGFSEGHALGNPGLPQRVPEDAHRDNPAPLSLAHERPGTLAPIAPSYRIATRLDNRKDQ